MSLIAPAYQLVNPHMMIPEIIMPYSQASGAFETLPNGEPRVMLGEDDLAVVIRRLDLRTKSSASQAAGNLLPGPDIAASMIATPTYLVRIHAEYDHHDTAAAGRYGFSLTDAVRLANQQAVCNTARTFLLYGANPANGEGLIYANGAYAIGLPPDSFGNDTAVTYDNGQMAFFIQQQIQAIKTRTNQLGGGRKFAIVGPQRTLGTFEYNVVQVTSYQRPGAGTTSTAGVIKDVLMANGDELIWAYDDTLIGKGAGGNDAVLIVMPEVEGLKQPKWNTNKFFELAPNMTATTMQLTDMIAPREITVALALGAVDTLFEQRMTSGWPVRPEGITIVSIQYQ